MNKCKCWTNITDDCNECDRCTHWNSSQFSDH